jgi:hypothetical protein
VGQWRVSGDGTQLHHEERGFLLLLDVLGEVGLLVLLLLAALPSPMALFPAVTALVVLGRAAAAGARAVLAASLAVLLVLASARSSRSGLASRGAGTPLFLREEHASTGVAVGIATSL